MLNPESQNLKIPKSEISFLLSEMRYSGLLFFLIIVLGSCQRDVDDVANKAEAKTYLDVAYGSDALQKIDVYLPEGRSSDSTRLILLVHGGAWAEGDKTDFTPYVTELQQRFPGWAFANMNYRLANATANHFPTQENDMKAAVEFLVQKSTEYKISQRFILLGASAGAHLSMLQAYKQASPRIRAVVDFFGPADMTDLYNSASTPIAQFAFQILMGGTPSSNPTLYQSSSPLNFVSAQSPPTIILHGDMDDIVPLAQSIKLKNKLQSLGVITEMHTFPNQGHDVWPSAVMDDAFDKIEVFLKANVQ